MSHTPLSLCYECSAKGEKIHWPIRPELILSGPDIVILCHTLALTRHCKNNFHHPALMTQVYTHATCTVRLY